MIKWKRFDLENIQARGHDLLPLKYLDEGFLFNQTTPRSVYEDRGRFEEREIGASDDMARSLRKYEVN